MRKIYNEQRTTTKIRPSINKKGVEEKADRISVVEKKDTAYYIALTKRFGWYEGIGRQLNKDEISSLPCYYRLTESDSLGHYTHIEAINGSGQFTTHHNISNYLISNDDESDIGADKVWKEMLRTVVQWELIPGIKNSHVAMESGHDSDGNLIYTYVMSYLNDSTVVGHYIDAFGEPISLRKGADAAKYIQVNIDKQGYERQILYLDNNAYFKPNTDGAYMQKKEYDNEGNIVMLYSCMMNGHPIKDKWGNCGWTAEYNNLGQLLCKQYIDDNMQPMRMPRLIKSSLDVMSRNYSYKDLRLQREYYLTNKGEKDCTEEGIHSREWQYDSKGNILCEISKDKNNKLCNDRRGIAQTFYGYDNQCHEIIRFYKDKNDNFVNDEAGLCMYKGSDTYKSSDGHDTIPVYKVIVSGFETKTINYPKNIIQIKKVNRQGREIESSYYNLAYQPVEVDSCFRKITTYRSESGKQIQESTHYSFKDTIRTLTVIDTKNMTRLVQRFHGTRLLSSFGQTMNKKMEVTGQFGYDALGQRARSHLEDALYYRVKSGTTYRGENSYIMGYNEYEEPSYVLISESPTSEIYCTKLFDTKNNNILLDEHNQPIKTDSLTKFRNSLNRVYCLEVISPKAKQLGLKSGDIIVKYAEFYYPQANKVVWDYRDHLQIETYLNRNNTKNVLLLRYDETNKSHKMISLTLPEGTENELGFLIHTVFYTEREAERYNTIVRQWLENNKIPLENFKTDNKHYGTHKVSIIRPYKISSANKTSWQAGLHEDVIVVAITSFLHDGSKIYTGIGNGEEKLWNQLTGECDSMTIFYTTNGKTLQNVTLPGKGSARAASYSYLPIDEFNNLLELEKKILSDSIKDNLSEHNLFTIPQQTHHHIHSYSDIELQNPIFHLNPLWTTEKNLTFKKEKYV